MSIFTLHTHPSDQSGDDLVCLEDRFDWFAALLPPLWAVANGLWLVLVMMVVFAAALFAVGQFLVLPIGLIYLPGVWWLGFEASHIRSKALAKKGWGEGVDIIASDTMMAEQQFFARFFKQAAAQPSDE